MYKTVRHGENSLQYTILPQTEEVLNNSGVKGKGRNYSPSIHARRSRRKHKRQLTLVVVLSLLLAIMVLCLSLYAADPQFYYRWFGGKPETVAITNAVPTEMHEGANSHQMEIKILPDIFSTLGFRVEATPTTMTKTQATTTTPKPAPSTSAGRESTSPLSKISSTIQTIPTEGNEVSIIEKPNKKQNIKEKTDVDNMSIKPWEKDTIIRPTIRPDSIAQRKMKYYMQDTSSERPAVATLQIFEDVLITTKGTTVKVPTKNNTVQLKLKDLKDAMLSVDDDDDFKESLEVDEVFSLPPLKPGSGIDRGDSDEVTVSKAEGGWYGARWPFVDTSSYFQWTGYSPGDNLLLPLLVAALSSVALVLLLALAVRRRKRSHSHIAQIGKLTSELATDDNTNLLTAENGEDAEE